MAAPREAGCSEWGRGPPLSTSEPSYGQHDGQDTANDAAHKGRNGQGGTLQTKDVVVLTTDGVLHNEGGAVDKEEGQADHQDGVAQRKADTVSPQGDKLTQRDEEVARKHDHSTPARQGLTQAPSFADLSGGNGERG